jgi:hypothetical protein
MTMMTMMTMMTIRVGIDYTLFSIFLGEALKR